MSNVQEHPNVKLRRHIELLEARVKLLEKEKDQRERIDLIILERFEEMKCLVTAAMKLLEQFPPQK